MATIVVHIEEGAVGAAVLPPRGPPTTLHCWVPEGEAICAPWEGRYPRIPRTQMATEAAAVAAELLEYHGSVQLACRHPEHVPWLRALFRVETCIDLGSFAAGVRSALADEYADPPGGREEWALPPGPDECALDAATDYDYVRSQQARSVREAKRGKRAARARKLNEEVYGDRARLDVLADIVDVALGPGPGHGQAAAMLCQMWDSVFDDVDSEDEPVEARNWLKGVEFIGGQWTMQRSGLTYVATVTVAATDKIRSMCPDCPDPLTAQGVSGDKELARRAAAAKLMMALTGETKANAVHRKLESLLV